MRVLIDTNVVLDFLLVREKFFPDANEIFNHIQTGEFEAFVSAITPVNTFYTARKEIGGEKALKLVKELTQLVSIARTDGIVISTAFDLGFTDYEDAVQCASAMAEGLDAIVTRNTKDYTNSPIQIYSPSEFLGILRNESTG